MLLLRLASVALVVVVAPLLALRSAEAPDAAIPARAATPPQGAAPRRAPAAPPKILLYVDMDGSSGVDRPKQVLYPNPEYFASRRFITCDVNAAIRGLKAGGAGEIVVTDAHGSGNSESPDVIVDSMDTRATFLMRDAPFDPYVDILDSTYSAIVAVGMHARARSAGFMAHTVTLEPYYVVNGKPITESELIAHSAARYGIPVIMVAGDDVLQRQIGEAFPGAEYAVVKRARGRANAELIPQAEVQAAIEQAARRAVEKLPSYRPYPVAPSYRFEIGFWNPRQAQLALSIDGIERVDSTTVRFTTTGFVEGYRRGSDATRMARLDAMQWLQQAVRAHSDGQKIMSNYLDLLVTAWLEPEKLPKAPPPAPTAARAKRRFWGSS